MNWYKRTFSAVVKNDQGDEVVVDYDDIDRETERQFGQRPQPQQLRVKNRWSFEEANRPRITIQDMF